MIIDKRTYKLFNEISDLTRTDYEIERLCNESDKFYYIDQYNLINIVDELKQEYDHLLELYEELKNGEE